MEKKVKVKPRKGVKIILFIILILFLLFLYARYINTHGFTVKEIAVINKNLNEAYNGLKIVQFSDLHYGRTTFEDDLSDVIDKINYINPDIIVFTGDLFDYKSISDKDGDLENYNIGCYIVGTNNKHSVFYIDIILYFICIAL